MDTHPTGTYLPPAAKGSSLDYRALVRVVGGKGVFQGLLAEVEFFPSW
jgi:hypothetical protein